MLDLGKDAFARPLTQKSLGFRRCRILVCINAAIKDPSPDRRQCLGILATFLSCVHANSKACILAARMSCGTAFGRVPTTL